MKSNNKNTGKAKKRGRHRSPEITEHDTKIFCCQMMQIYMILNKMDGVVWYLSLLMVQKKMNLHTVMKIYNSVSIPVDLLLSIIEVEKGKNYGGDDFS